MKNIKEKGLTIIEALISTALIGIGFIAIFQMVNFSVTSINTSGERTKANFLSSMIAEGFIGYKESIGGLNNTDKEMVFYKDGKAYINNESEDIRCLKFSEYYWPFQEEIGLNVHLLQGEMNLKWEIIQVGVITLIQLEQ